MELLFESRPEIRKLNGKLRWIQQRPTLCEQPVLESSTSGDGAGASIYGSVLHDGGRYRMWYQGWPRDWNGGNSAIVCYAESDDGITWRKPELNLDDRFPQPQNVTDLGLHAPAVFIDPDAPASHRYRATGHGKQNYAGANRHATVPGYYTAHSADGLHWQLDQEEPTWPQGDVINSIYHPQRKCGLVTMKRNVYSGGIHRRALWDAELRDGQWQARRCALVPDDFDDIAARARGLASADYYGMAMQLAGDATVGFVWQFRHALPRTQGGGGGGRGVFGVVDVGLAYQPQRGAAWLHAPGRLDFINSQDIPWRPGGCVYTASCPVEVGDEHRLYLCATDPHGWYLDPAWQVDEQTKAKMIERGFAQIGYAAWPRHRLFGYRADPQGTIELALTGHTQPSELRLNYHTHHPDGFVTVAVKGSDTQTHETCRPLTGSDTAGTVAWEQGTVIQPSVEGVTVIEIALTEATVWAWQIEPV